jgi:hypothetical protein
MQGQGMQTNAVFPENMVKDNFYFIATDVALSLSRKKWKLYESINCSNLCFKHRNCLF